MINFNLLKYLALDAEEIVKSEQKGQFYMHMVIYFVDCMLFSKYLQNVYNRQETLQIHLYAFEFFYKVFVLRFNNGFDWFNYTIIFFTRI